MATSGSYDFNVTRDQLIKMALQHISALGEGETPTADVVTEASLLLNMIVKLREADGMPLWALKRGYVLPVTNVSSIATDSHIVTSYVHTYISTAASATDTTIEVDGITGMSASDQIGIELEDGTMQWTTISGAPSGSTVTLASALDDDVAVDADVYVYTASTDRIQKPVRLLQANIFNVLNSTSHDIEVVDRDTYFKLNAKTAENTPVLVYYDRASTSTTNLDNGQMFIWPRFANGDNIIEFSYHRPFQDFDASTDNPDFPQAFYLPLMLELAALLGPKFRVHIDERRALFNEAKMYLDQALTTVSPEGSLTIVPERRG